MNNKLIIYIALLLISLSACTSDFEETNTNPNNPESAPLTNVFGYVIESLAGEFGKTEMHYPAPFVGHVTNGTYTDVINYYTDPGNTIWESTYSTILTNINYVIEGAKEDGNTNQEAAGLVLRTYAIQLVTDIYGKVPYSEAGKATEEIIHPSYDDEDSIYYDLLNTLETANSLFDEDNGGDLGDGDLIYGGDVSQWKKFCNSLRLRLAIRISNVVESKAKEEIAKILNSPATYPVFESNDDNSFLTFPGGEWIEPWTAEHSSIGDDYIAKPITDTLLAYNDPRLAEYAESLSDGSFSGLEVGTDADTVYSRVNDQFVNNQTGNVYFLKYAEVEFIKAEAIKRNFVSGNAEEEYKNAITASCKEYDIDDETIAGYLKGSSVSWNNTLNQIYIQKWIALFRQSWEAWAEMRRTDVPALSPASHSAYTGHNRTPFRFPYPDSEQKLNSENIPSDVAEDDYFWGYQIWWDTRTGVQ